MPLRQRRSGAEPLLSDCMGRGIGRGLGRELAVGWKAGTSALRRNLSEPFSGESLKGSARVPAPMVFVAVPFQGPLLNDIADGEAAEDAWKRKLLGVEP